MRKLLIGVGATVVSVVMGAIGVDFGAAIYAEYKLSRTIRAAADLNWDPSVAILGFPFIPQAASRHYDELEVKATDVVHPRVEKASLEATMHEVDLADSSWLIQPGAELPVGVLESRIIIDSAHLGRFMGINDLMVEAPPVETNDATGGTTESGISGNKGLVFTGTPTAADFGERVSVSVDATITGDDQTTLEFSPTGLLTGPGTADQEVPEDKLDAVIEAFRSTLPDQKLPFGVAPTALGARGSEIIVEGITEGITITPEGFRPS